MLFAELARVGSRRSPKDNLTAAEPEEEEATTRRPHVCGAALHPGDLTAPQHPPALERETATATPLSRSVKGCAPAKPNSILNNLAPRRTRALPESAYSPRCARRRRERKLALQPPAEVECLSEIIPT